MKPFEEHVLIGDVAIQPFDPKLSAPIPLVTTPKPLSLKPLNLQQQVDFGRFDPGSFQTPFGPQSQARIMRMVRTWRDVQYDDAFYGPYIP